MAKMISAIGVVSLALAGIAQAQTADNNPGASGVAGAEDTSRSVNSDRDQQFALDHIRDESASAKRSSSRSSNRIVAATTADLTAGATVHDMDGVPLGTIEAVKPEGVQIKGGTGQVMVPADVFGVNRKKLVLNVKKADFDQQAGAAK